MGRSIPELAAAWKKLQSENVTSFLVTSVKERTIAEIQILEELIENGCDKIPDQPMGILWLLNDRRELLDYILRHNTDAQ